MQSTWWEVDSCIMENEVRIVWIGRIWEKECLHNELLFRMDYYDLIPIDVLPSLRPSNFPTENMAKKLFYDWRIGQEWVGGEQCKPRLIAIPINMSMCQYIGRSWKVESCSGIIVGRICEAWSSAVWRMGPSSSSQGRQSFLVQGVVFRLPFSDWSGSRTVRVVRQLVNGGFGGRMANNYTWLLEAGRVVLCPTIIQLYQLGGKTKFMMWCWSVDKQQQLPLFSWTSHGLGSPGHRIHIFAKVLLRESQFA